MLPRCLLLYFLSFSLAAGTAAKADFPASDLRKLSEEDLVELDEFLSRVQQVLHPKDTVVDKLESVQAPFARLVAKLANVPPVKPLHRLTQKVKADQEFSDQKEVAAAAEMLLEDQRESYLSMRLLLDALFGLEDVESDAESGSDSEDSGSDDEGEDEGEDDEADEDEDAENGAGEDDTEAGTGDGGLGDEDVDDYDWFYRIFGSKAKGAVAAVEKAPEVASLELAALARRSSGANQARNRVMAQAESPFKSPEAEDTKLVDTKVSLSHEPTLTEESPTKFSPTETWATETPTTKIQSTETLSTEIAPAPILSAPILSRYTKSSSTTAVSTTRIPASESTVAKEPKLVSPESSTLKLQFSVPQETGVPEDLSSPKETVPEEAVPVITGPAESDACNLTFGNWSWDCAPLTSSSARNWSLASALALVATTLLAIFVV